MRQSFQCPHYLRFTRHKHPLAKVTFPMVLEHFSALSTLTYCAKAAHESTPRAAERFLLKIYQGCLIEANIPWGGDPIPDGRSSSTLKNNPTDRKSVV